jgi:HK97 gp10 family phage protein
VANRVRLRLSGFAELRHAIKAYGTQVANAAVSDMTDTVAATEAEAKASAPVKTGTLRNSIKGSVSTDGYAVKGTVRATAKYAQHVEFGTEHADKQPFLLPAAVRNRKRLNQKLAKTVTRLAPDGLGTPRILGDGPGTPRVGGD